MTTKPSITIYGKPDCKWCVAAKSFLDRRHIEYRYVDIFDLVEPQDQEDVEDRQTVNDIMATGYKSVPMIVINNEFIGGYMDLEKRSFE